MSLPTPGFFIAFLPMAVVLAGCVDAGSVSGVPTWHAGAIIGTGFPDGIIAEFDADAGERPEGIAMNGMGDLFVGINTTGDIHRFRIGHSGNVEQSRFATLDAGLLGLTVDGRGRLYAAVASFDPATHGVWRLNHRGDAERLAGSEAIFFPNALTLDDHGNLYVTSSSGPPTGEGTWADGQIWRVAPGHAAELWLQHPLLTGTGNLPTGTPFPLGANGIAHRGHHLVVANTEQGTIVSVPIRKHGPGTPAPLAGGFAIPDGLALDVVGNIYVLEIGRTRLVRVAPDGHNVEELAGPLDGVHFATSLVFGTRGDDRRSVFLANAAFPFPHPAPVGPSVLKVDVGVPGQPVRPAARGLLRFARRPGW